MSKADQDPDLSQLRRNFDLLLRAQRHGKTGYVVSDITVDRVYWSDSLFEQRKIAPRPYFTRAEGMDFIHPDDRAGFLAAREQAMKDGRAFTHELRIICGDGTIIWESGHSQPQFDAEGRFTGLLSVVDDITDQKTAATTLMEQEATYRALFNSIGDAIFLTLDGAFVDCNEAALQMFGGTREQVISQSPWQFSPARQPDGQTSAKKARNRIAAALKGERQIFEWRHKRLDGSEFDAEVVLSRVEGAAEPYFFGVVRDISERKRAEAQLKAAYDKFAGAFNSSTDAMIVMRTSATEVGQGVVLDANDAASRMFGLERHELIGRRAVDSGLLVDPANYSALREIMLSKGTVTAYPTQQRRRDGTIIDTEISASVFEVDNELLSILVIRDVTGARGAERKILDLNQSLETMVRQLRDITDNLPAAISYQDLGGCFRFVNRTMELWFAAEPGGMIGKTVADLVGQDYFDAIAPIRERIAKGHSKLEGTVPYPDGATRTVEATIVQDKTPDGTVRGRYTLLIDLTERKAAEEILNQSQKMQAIGKLTGGVAHDFNNLLAVISGNLELAAEALGNGNKRVSMLLEPARRAAERGSTLTRSLLAFSRQQPLSPQISDLNALARDMTELLKRTLPSNIAMEFSGGTGLWACEVDPGQLQNALLNLVVNARDAMPDGGRLKVESRNVIVDDGIGDLAPGQYVVLSVADTGTGMPPEVIARAFEPFYTTKGLGEGTGLGLSMVYGFAKQSGGHVAIDSTVGRGTTVRIYLPRWIDDTGRQTTGAPVPSPGRNETLLVVEDDEDMRFVAVTMLTSLGYTVLEAPTGPKALDLLARHDEVALLVTDVVLAGSMNGRRLAEEAKSRRPGLPVVYMSGYTEDAITRQGRLEPGVHFIQKPFRRQDLADKVREALHEG